MIRAITLFAALAPSTLAPVTAASPSATAAQEAPRPAPRLDAELLFAHPGLVPGDDARVRADLLAALEAHPDAPLAVEAVHVLDWHAEGMSRGEVLRLAALAARLRDAEACFQARRIVRRERQRFRFSAEPLGPEVVSDGEGAVGGFEVLGPFGPLDHRAPAAMPAPEGAPEPTAETAELALSERYAASAGLTREWRDTRDADHEGPETWPTRFVYPQGGVSYVRAFVRGVPGVERAVLELRTRGAFRAYWNLELVHDERRLTPSAVAERFLAEVELREGWNLLLVRLVTAEDQALSARLIGADGRELATPRAAEGERPPLTGWTRTDSLPVVLPSSRLGADESDGPFRAALEAARALIARRPDLALAVPEPVDDPRAAAAWRLVRLRALNAARHIPDEVARRLLLEQLDAIEADGPRYGLARSFRVRQLQREDRPLDAMAEAEAWIAAAPDLVAPRLARIGCLGQLDRDGVLRRVALEELALAHPGRADVQLALAEARRGAGDEVGAHLAATRALTLDATSDQAFDLVLEYARRAGRVDELRALLARLEADSRADASEGLVPAQLGALLDELVTAAPEEGWRAQERAWNPADPDLAWAAGDAALRAGALEAAREAFAAELALDPSDPTTRDTLRLLGDPDPAEAFFAAFAPDLAAAAERAKGVTDASVVEVLDSGLVYFFPDGASHGRFHTVSLARDRKGTEELHQHAVQDGTRVARVRTRDGRYLEPLEVDGQWTMPSLEPGDAVEFVWDIQAAGTPGAAPDERGWRFSSFEKAFPTSRWVLFVPDGLPGRLDVRNFEGSHETLPAAGGTVHVLTASSPRLAPEPLRPSDLEVLPLAAYSGDRTRDDELLAWDATLGSLVELPADLEREVAPFVAEHTRGDARATAEALYRALDERIREQRGGFRAAEVWWQRRGLPLFLLAALYDRAGVPYELAVMERSVSPELDPEPLTAFANQRPLERVALRLGATDALGDPVWIVATGQPGFPFGAIPADMAGAATFVRGADGWRAEELPRSQLDATWDADVALRYVLGPDGSAAVEGTFVVSTAQGDVLRRQLREATAQQRDAFARRQVNGVVRGLDLERATFELDSPEPGARLVFAGKLPRYVVERPGDGGAPSEYLADPPFLPLGLDQGLGPAERKWPLVFRSSLRVRVRATLELGEAWTFLQGPNATHEAREGFTIDLSLDPTATPGSCVCEQRVVRRGAVIAPDEMPAFLARMGQLEAEFRRPLRLARRP